MKNQRGFGLLGNLLGIGVMMAVGAGVAVFKGDVEDYVTAQTRGGEYVTLLKAGEAYAKKNQTNIMLNNGSASMTPNIATLKAAGFLAQTYSSNAPIRLGGDLSVVLKHEPVGCPGQSCVIQISVVPTTGSTKEDNKPNYKLATNIALAAGGYGWSTATDTDLFVAKNGQKILNPLVNVPAVAIAATWLPSNKPGSTDTHPEYQNLPCPSPQTGLITNTRNVWTDKWGGQGVTPWVLFSSTCVMPPPTCANGASDYPTCTPPTCANGASDYPTCTPPPVTCPNGATNPPTCTLPPATCANGATNPPTCSLSPPTCANGATNPPTCSLSPPTCSNGATNPPTCSLSPPKPITILICSADNYIPDSSNPLMPLGKLYAQLINQGYMPNISLPNPNSIIPGIGYEGYLLDPAIKYFNAGNTQTRWIFNMSVCNEFGQQCISTARCALDNE